MAPKFSPNNPGTFTFVQISYFLRSAVADPFDGRRTDSAWIVECFKYRTEVYLGCAILWGSMPVWSLEAEPGPADSLFGAMIIVRCSLYCFFPHILLVGESTWSWTGWTGLCWLTRPLYLEE